MAKPVISYPGAKWRFWQYIKPYIPKDIKDWREPFFGGGSMSLSIADDPEFNLERMVVGDLAPEIWAMWVGIRDYAPDVQELVLKMFKQWCPTQEQILGVSQDEPGWNELYEQVVKEGKALWQWSQTVDCTTLSIPERAARTWLVNRISFSGLGDSGSISKDHLIDFNGDITSRILLAQPLLQKMEIKNCSFEETMKDVDKDKTFIFLDPPYYRQEDSGLYGKGGDTHHGFPHDHFAEFTKNTNCRWFVTYDDSPKVRQMFRGKPVYGGKCYTQPFTIPGGYTMALRNSEDALQGEELFLYNYDITKADSGFDISGLI